MYEKTIVTEDLVHDNNCYNIKIGGDYGTTVGTILVTDKQGNMHRCTKEDERYINGEWKPFGTGMVVCFDSITNKKVYISKEFYLNNIKRFTTLNHNCLITKDKNGNAFYISKNDERYKNGELVPFWCGMKHTEDTKKKMHETYIKNNHQKGKNNSQFDTCWVNDGKSNKKIRKDELDTFLEDGWVKGRIVIPTEKCFKAQCKLNKDVVEEKLKKGQPKESIAREFNIDKGTLYRFIKRMNI